MYRLSFQASDLSLYLVTDEAEKCRHSLLYTVQQAVLGGVTIVQYRTVKRDHDTLLSEVLPLRDYLRSVHVPLIVNNNIDLALEIGADGIHIGQSDTPVAEARRRIGEGLILGLSVSTPEQMAAVNPDWVDYVGCGPVFPTISKLNAPKDLGVEGWAALAAACPVPIVAIGGLDASRARKIRATGRASGVAVVSAICAAEDPRAAAQSLR